MIKSALVFLTLLVSCNSYKVSPEQNTLNFDVILERATGGKSTEDIVIVSDKNELDTIFSTINSNQEPNYTVPEINFETELVIVFFMGEKNTGGYSISVESINDLEEHVGIYYKEVAPKPTDMVTMAFTQPYCIIKTKKPSKELKFIKID